jgi:hypothetical protein
VSHIRTKPSTDTYRENYDRIFGPKRKAKDRPKPDMLQVRTDLIVDWEANADFLRAYL